jgi:DNA primase
VDSQRQRFKCWACGKAGDVFTFIQEHDHVDFREALEILARRTGISLEKNSGFRQNPGRAVMLELVRWAAAEYHRCLLESPSAEAARHYLGERRLEGDTVRRFELGYAPASGDWLAMRASAAGKSTDMLEKVGLLGPRAEGRGHYDRFRDRVMFPIRDPGGRTLGFGGRILPSSPYADRAPKYYNSADSILFSKSELLYGIDQARQAAATAGYLAVVEGYTDVLMAHQMGVSQVVSTMGTALNARHVKQLKKWVPRVVLVFDADAGGDTGVDRALEIFVSQEVDLAVASLPAGMDPCDLLVARGPDAFREALAGAVNALEFKLNQVLAAAQTGGIEGQRRAVEAVLGVIALAPELPGHEGAVKRELIASRIAQRMGLREETVWARLRELRAARRPVQRAAQDAGEARTAPAPRREQELLQVLLADPDLVAETSAEIAPEEMEHPGLRAMLQRLYALHAQGKRPDLEGLRGEIDNPALAQKAQEWQEMGRIHVDRAAWLRQLFDEFRRKRAVPHKQKLQNQLQAASDHTEAVELLRQLQERTVSSEPEP